MNKTEILALANEYANRFPYEPPTISKAIEKVVQQLLIDEDAVIVGSEGSEEWGGFLHHIRLVANHLTLGLPMFLEHEGRIAMCDNCDSETAYMINEWQTIPDLAQRIEPGDRLPACECPICGALCYPDKEEEE